VWKKAASCDQGSAQRIERVVEDYLFEGRRCPLLDGRSDKRSETPLHVGCLTARVSIGSGCVEDRDVARLLAMVNPTGRVVLRRAMRADKSDRDELASALMRDRSNVGQDLADLVDLASMEPGIRRQLIRVLGELEAHGQ
jgi:hypothetical protein